MSSALLRAEDDPGYEIVSHRVALQLFPLSKAFTSIDTIEVRFTKENIDRLSLKLLPVYAVSGVMVNGRNVKFSQSKDYCMIEELPEDTLVEAVIQYSGRVMFQSDFAGINEDRAVFHEEGILPFGPRMLRFVRMAITVPSSWSAISVGSLKEKKISPDSATYIWESRDLLADIGWICAGMFVQQEVTERNLVLNTFLFTQDSSSSQSLLSLAKDVLRFYNKKFTTYRFPKLSIIEVDNWVGGRNVLAIAGPSFIMVKKVAFETEDTFNQVSSILPHEIAHQWWPMTVFIDHEDAALLAEGLCEYSALLYAEASGRMSKRDSLGQHPLLRPLLMRVTKGEDLPLQQKADLRSLPTHYLKASYVHNMLRTMMGDSLFSLLYHEYARRFHLRKALLTDFQLLAEEFYRKPLGWFFDQWVKNRGVPRMKIYNVKSAKNNGKWVTSGRVRMVGYEKYTSIVPIEVETPGGFFSTAVWLGTDSVGSYRNDVPFDITTAEKPSAAFLDVHSSILKIHKIPVKMGDLRDPADGIMVVGTGESSHHLLHLARRDSAAMERSGWSVRIKADTSITLADLQSERVIIYGKRDQNKLIESLRKKFPYDVHGNSISINGEVVSDSSLALIQVMESPYLVQGLVCWVAPLSNSAEPELLPFDYSWVLMRGRDMVTGGTWTVKDEDVTVQIP